MNQKIIGKCTKSTCPFINVKFIRMKKNDIPVKKKKIHTLLQMFCDSQRNYRIHLFELWQQSFQHNQLV